MGAARRTLVISRSLRSLATVINTLHPPRLAPQKDGQASPTSQKQPRPATRPVRNKPEASQTSQKQARPVGNKPDRSETSQTSQKTARPTTRPVDRPSVNSSVLVSSHDQHTVNSETVQLVSPAYNACCHHWLHVTRYRAGLKTC
jgi:hypothetical protein